MRVDQAWRDNGAAKIAHLLAAVVVMATPAGCGRIVTLLLQRTSCAGARFEPMILAGGGWSFPHPEWGYGRLAGRSGHVRKSR